MRGLYAIVDVASVERARLDVVRVASAILVARPAALQLRAKAVGARRTLELLRALAPLSREAGVPLFANDRPDLAALAGCDGVHVGQDDLSVTDVRAVMGRRDRRPLVGLSTHDAAQVASALREDIDYVAIGPVHGTRSKENPDPVLGPAGLRELASIVRRERPDLPIVAIGGLTPARVEELAPVVDAFAVIGALLPSETGAATLDAVTENARALVRAATARRAETPTVRGEHP